MKNFWQNLTVPFTALAPLDGITDCVFRQMMVDIGKPDVLFTEFTSCEGLRSAGFEKVARNLIFKPDEQPVIAQVWGTDPKKYYECGKIIKKLGFAGIDINMGCPQRSAIKEGACSALIKNPSLAKEIIGAARKGASGLPLSIKTRIGFDKIDINGWTEFLLRQKLSALTIHLRTAKELSKVPAHWELMPDIINLRKAVSSKTIIIGNGDVSSIEEVKEKHQKYGCEGIMIGRGIFLNPWIFNKLRAVSDISARERFDTYLRHIELFDKTWGDKRNFENLKKFCKAYINNFPEASKCRDQIMQVKSLKELKQTVSLLLQKHTQL